MLRPLASSSDAKSAKVVILGAFVHVTLKSSESKLHVYILFPVFFGWMRTNGGRNVCLFNTVKIKVCSPVITTDWDRPSQATVTQSVIPLRQQPWLTNWTTLTGIASFSSYYCRWSLSFKLTKLVSIHQILIIMDSRGTLLDVTVGIRLPSLPKLKPCRVSTGLLSQYLIEMNQNWPSLDVNLKSSGSQLRSVFILFPVPFFGEMRKKRREKGASAKQNKKPPKNNNRKQKQKPLTKLTTIILKTTNKQKPINKCRNKQNNNKETCKKTTERNSNTWLTNTKRWHHVGNSARMNIHTLKHRPWPPTPTPLFSPTLITPFSMLLLSWCLMSSDVIWHIRDKLWPMPKHGLIRKVYACLAVTCHLHFWQNDRDFLRATVVTRGWNGYRNKSQHRKSTLEKKILRRSSRIRTRDLSITSPVL